VSDWSAVTADEAMRFSVQKEADRLGISDRGSVLIGNWQAAEGTPGSLCDGETYDTILADYLVGSVDGFAPYFQDKILGVLASHLSPGGRMYVVGLQPLPDKVQQGDDPMADVVCRVRAARDACILLAGECATNSV